MIQVEDNLVQSLLAAQVTDDHPVTTLRKEARKALETLGLPDLKNEEYRYIPLRKAIENNFTLSGYTANKGTSPTIKKSEIQPGSHEIVCVNGQFIPALSNITTLEGVVISTLEEAFQSNPDLVKEHFGRYADFSGDGFVAWNTATWNGGLFIHVPANVQLTQPLLIRYLQDASQQEIISVSRNLIIVESNSQAQIIQQFDSQGEHNHLANVVTEGAVHENATLRLYQLETDPGNQYLFNQTSLYQKNHSCVETFTITLDGKLIRNNLSFYSDGEGCESNMTGLYLLQGDTVADNHTIADHKKPHSISNELYKGVMSGKSKGIFNGKIFVRPHAQKTNAFQSNRNILLSDQATVHTKPQLEIWADDVKCSHGCTSGQLDEEALFYLQARGINKSAAQAMLLYAFAGEVLEKVKLPELRVYLENLVDQRLKALA